MQHSGLVGLLRKGEVLRGESGTISRTSYPREGGLLQSLQHLQGPRGQNVSRGKVKGTTLATVTAFRLWGERLCSAPGMLVGKMQVTQEALKGHLSGVIQQLLESRSPVQSRCSDNRPACCGRPAPQQRVLSPTTQPHHRAPPSPAQPTGPVGFMDSGSMDSGFTTQHCCPY